MDSSAEKDSFRRRLVRAFLEFAHGQADPDWPAFRQTRDIFGVGGPNAWCLLEEIVKQAEGDDELRMASELAFEHWASDSQNVADYVRALRADCRGEPKFKLVALLSSRVPAYVKQLLVIGDRGGVV